MKKMLGIFFFTFLMAMNAFANTQTFLGPIAQAQFSKALNDDVAGAFIIEGGPRQYRANGTVGLITLPNQRLKFTGEYLGQDISYQFFTGAVNKWVRQGALGLSYQVGLGDNFRNYLTFSGYYTDAPSVRLSTITGSYLSGTSVVSFIDQRKIAGSKSTNLSPGLVVHPWTGAEASITMNYDNVRYDISNNPRIIIAKGLGGTFTFDQTVGSHLHVGGLAANRAPFNNYQADVGWNIRVPAGVVSLGVFGGYTSGKHFLPSTSVMGFNVKFDGVPAVIPTVTPTSKPAEPLSTWVAKPAVYMPQVLALADEALSTTSCPLPIFTGPIPDQSNPAGSVDLPAGTFFTGTGLTFSATGLPAGVGIDSGTGAISGTYVVDSPSVIITATSSCGSSVSSNSFAITH